MHFYTFASNKDHLVQDIRKPFDSGRPRTSCRRVVWAFVVLSAMAACEQLTQSATTVSGSVSGEWSLEGSPYYVASDTVIVADNTLTVHPGVNVLFQGPYALEVYGGLLATGTADQPIVFKRALVDVGWDGIKFRSTSTSSTLAHCQIYGSVDSGITIENTPPALSHCIIADNYSPSRGGGVSATLSTGRLLLDSCIISNNVASTAGGGVWLHGNASFTRSTLVANRTTDATSGGGGIRIITGNVTMDGCELTGNRAGYVGGGVDMEAACEESQWVNLHLTNCKLTTNRVDAGYGAGVFGQGCGRVYAANCTFVGNTGPAVHMFHQWDMFLLLTNSVVFFNNNGGAQIVGNASVAYSTIQGMVPDGPGNLNTDPHLDPLTLRPLAGSPCIDTGHPNSAYNDTCFPQSAGGARNDMGAFGGPGACAWLVAPVIVSQPENQASLFGSTASFAVAAVGSSPLTYQWLFNGQPSGGALAVR